MINHTEIAQHWINSLPKDLENYELHIEMAKRVTAKYINWKLKRISINKIMNYTGTSLENDFFINQKVDNFVKSFKSETDVPCIILIPLDRSWKKPFLEHKYQDCSIEWEPADGIHRLFMFIKLGFKDVLALVPEVSND